MFVCHESVFSFSNCFSLYITFVPWSLQCGLVYSVFFININEQDITYAHISITVFLYLLHLLGQYIAI